MDIFSHPIWEQIAPTTRQTITIFKKPFHIGRFYAARSFAKLFPRKMFIGVTGTVGKTTTVSAVSLVLGQKYKILSTLPSLDPILNIPITILKIKPKIIGGFATQKVILEMGIEYPGEMDIYLNLVRPATAIVTSIALQHSEFLGNLESIAREKGKLVQELPKDGLAILNYDDPMVRKMADETKAEVIFFGTDSKHCHIWASNTKIENLKTTFELNYGVERVLVSYPLLGIHQIYPALAAAAAGLSEGLNLTSIKRVLENMKPQEHRLNALDVHGGSIILDDSYNGSPISVEAALDTLERISARRRIVCLGETKELGEFSESEHRKIARAIYKNRLDLVLLGGGEASLIADELIRLGFPSDRMEYGLQNPEMVRRLLKVLGKGDVCLVKGSRSLRLDEVVERVAKKQK